jgi:hypothetical protein
LPGEKYLFTPVNYGEINLIILPSNIKLIISVDDYRINHDDNFVLVENSLKENPYENRVIKMNSWGNIYWEFGRGILSNPKDVFIDYNGELYIST